MGHCEDECKCCVKEYLLNKAMWSCWSQGRWNNGHHCSVDFGSNHCGSSLLVKGVTDVGRSCLAKDGVTCFCVSLVILFQVTLGMLSALVCWTLPPISMRASSAFNRYWLNLVW